MKSQNKSKSKSKKKHKHAAAGSSAEPDAAKPDGGKLKLVLRLSADSNQGEKRWMIGGKPEEAHETQEITEQPDKQQKLPPIRIKASLLKSAESNGDDEGGTKQKRSPRRRGSSPAPTKEDKNDVEDEEDAPKPRVSTRVRKSTEKAEYLFSEEMDAAVPRSKRKRKEASSQLPTLALTEPPKRPSKRARQSLNETDEAFLFDEGNHEDDVATKRKGSLRRVSKPAKVEKQAEGESVPKKPLPLKKVLSTMLTRLIRKDTYGFFFNPVTEEVAPGYFSIITQPMDFSTMRTKLANGKYTTLESFKDDVKLICNNAKTYNAPSTVYYQEAVALLECQEELLKIYVPKIDTNRKPASKVKGGSTQAGSVLEADKKEESKKEKEDKEKEDKEEPSSRKKRSRKDNKTENTESSTDAMSAMSLSPGNAFSQPLPIPDAQTPEKPKRKYSRRGDTPRKRSSSSSNSFALSGAANPLAMSFSSPLSVTSPVSIPYTSNMYMPAPTTHSVAYSLFKQHQPAPQPTQPAVNSTSLTGFVNSIPPTAVPQVKGFLNNLTSPSPTTVSLPSAMVQPQPPQTTTPQPQPLARYGISSQVLDDFRAVDISTEGLDKGALDALASLEKEGFDVSFLSSLDIDVPQTTGEAAQPLPEEPQKATKLDDNIQTHLAGLSDHSIQAMLNKNAELLLNLQLSQYERATPTLTEKESRMATQLCESLTALSSKVTPREVASPSAAAQAMSSRVQRLGVPPTPVQQHPPVTFASPQRPTAPPQPLQPPSPLPGTAMGASMEGPSATTPVGSAATPTTTTPSTGLTGSTTPSSIFTLHTFSPAPVPLTLNS